MLRIRTYPAFSQSLQSWEGELLEDGSAQVRAEWDHAGERRVVEEVIDFGEGKARKVLQDLARLIPVGRTQVTEADDIGGYELELETERGLQKWVDAGVLSYSRQDRTTQAINEIFREVEALVMRHLKPMGYPDSRSKKGRRK